MGLAHCMPSSADRAHASADRVLYARPPLLEPSGRGGGRKVVARLVAKTRVGAGQRGPRVTGGSTRSKWRDRSPLRLCALELSELLHEPSIWTSNWAHVLHHLQGSLQREGHSRDCLGHIAMQFLVPAAPPRQHTIRAAGSRAASRGDARACPREQGRHTSAPIFRRTWSVHWRVRMR